jgi:uncharacterized protein
MIARSITPTIKEYLEDKIILLSGPRQVGKTFLSKQLCKTFQYYNFDLSDHKKDILDKSWARNGDLVILDEIHKLKKWKQWIKGIYDTEKGKNKFILTGSSRIDTFKKAGDSLAGRHISLRLNPFSIKEIGQIDHYSVAEQMLVTGSFPEPFLSGSAKKAALWRRSHLDVIVRQDLLVMESVKDIASIELLIQLLRHRVGQQIVYKNIADELQVSPITVKKWIQILESFFIIFVVYPYTKNVAEAVKKEPKIYFYDIGQVTADIGFKIENLVALHLLKRNQFLEDTQGHQLRLGYIRDKKKREIDFVITQDQKLTHLIEVKKSDDQFNSHLNYYSLRLKPENSVQLVFDLKREKDFETHQIKSLSKYLYNLET